jgi:hypothetical protein
LLTLPVGIKAENGDFASATRSQAFQNLDGRGLAGAVGSEQAENFSRLNLEVDSFHGVDLTVGFLQTVDRDRCGRGVHRGETGYWRTGRESKSADDSGTSVCGGAPRATPFPVFFC